MQLEIQNLGLSKISNTLPCFLDFQLYFMHRDSINRTKTNQVDINKLLKITYKLILCPIHVIVGCFFFLK